MVRMHRRRGGVTGIYSCVIPDDNAGVQILYTGVYTNNTGKTDFHFMTVCMQSIMFSFDFRCT